MITITILGAHKRKGHGARFLCPISRKEGHVAEILFVDDNDLIHIGMNKDQTALEAHTDLQARVNS